MAEDDPKVLWSRLEARDETLWPKGNVSANRLGWLDIARQMEKEARELRAWADSIDQETIVLLGMGGSSLGPLVLGELGRAFGKPTGRRLVVCDTTEPSTVAEAPIEDAFMLISSKSGTTLEPNVLFSYARSRTSDPRRYAFITDPGTPLDQLGTELGVHRVFRNEGDIGGRYSVLSYFGLVPAVLVGYDIEALCEAVRTVDRVEAAELGRQMGMAAKAGQNKATIVVDPAHRVFGLWVEQLIAESTGKHGTGVVPVPTSEREPGNDRFYVDIKLDRVEDVAAQFFRCEVAVAICGHVLGIDPFDEPNVAESKENTNRVLSELPLPKLDPKEPEELHPYLEETLRDGDYVSLQAYLPYGSDAKLEKLRCAVRDAHKGVATTAGYGPRFLHSTGQLHKGGPASLVAVQIVPKSARPHLAIPGKNYDFATLIDAQAIGDLESLASHKRRAIRIAVDDLDEVVA